MLFIVYTKASNDATSIRTMSYAQGFAKNGIPTTMVFLIKGNAYWKSKTCNNLDVIHCEDFCPKVLKSRKILQFLWGIWYVVRHVKKGDVIFSPSSNVILAYIARFKKVGFFTEFTEVQYHEIRNTLRNRIIDTLALRAARMANGTFVISQALKPYYEQLKVSNINVVNMFVDIERFSHKQNKYDPTLISYCGTISLYKDGVDVLLKAFAMVVHKLPDIRLQIIGGWQNEDVRSAIENLIKILNLEKNVILTGKVDMDSLVKLLSNSAVLVLARPNNLQAKYGFPTKLGEYLCSGRPVVVTRVGEMDLFLEDRESCIFANADDVNDFADKLEWAVVNMKQADIIGQKGREIAQLNFSSVIESRKVAQIMNLI